MGVHKIKIKKNWYYTSITATVTLVRVVSSAPFTLLETRLALHVRDREEVDQDGHGRADSQNGHKPDYK